MPKLPAIVIRQGPIAAACPTCFLRTMNLANEDDIIKAYEPFVSGEQELPKDLILHPLGQRRKSENPEFRDINPKGKLAKLASILTGWARSGYTSPPNWEGFVKKKKSVPARELPTSPEIETGFKGGYPLGSGPQGQSKTSKPWERDLPVEQLGLLASIRSMLKKNESIIDNFVRNEKCHDILEDFNIEQEKKNIEAWLNLASANKSVMSRKQLLELQHGFLQNAQAEVKRKKEVFFAPHMKKLKELPHEEAGGEHSRLMGEFLKTLSHTEKTFIPEYEGGPSEEELRSSVHKAKKTRSVASPQFPTEEAPTPSEQDVSTTKGVEAGEEKDVQKTREQSVKIGRERRQAFPPELHKIIHGDDVGSLSTDDYNARALKVMSGITPYIKVFRPEGADVDDAVNDLFLTVKEVDDQLKTTPYEPHLNDEGKTKHYIDLIAKSLKTKHNAPLAQLTIPGHDSITTGDDRQPDITDTAYSKRETAVDVAKEDEQGVTLQDREDIVPSIPVSTGSIPVDPLAALEAKTEKKKKKKQPEEETSKNFSYMERELARKARVKAERAAKRKDVLTAMRKKAEEKKKAK